MVCKDQSPDRIEAAGICFEEVKSCAADLPCALHAASRAKRKVKPLVEVYVDDPIMTGEFG